MKKTTISYGRLCHDSSLPKSFLIICMHVAMLYIVYQLLVLCTVIGKTDLHQFKQWDANWYASIARDGYQYSATEPTNSGFFPLFAYEWKTLWKLTGGGVGRVCLFNGIVFFAGMLLLKRAFHFSWTYFFLFLSLPSNMFMFVPYTEATFFFFSALVLAGLKLKQPQVVLVGLFLAALTRPAAVFFIPAVICMEILAYINMKIFLKNVFMYCSVPLLGTLLVLIFQYRITGVWFAYFKTQSLFWKRTFQFPDFPLTTWGGPKVLWLDGAAIFFGLLAGVILLFIFIRKFRKQNTDTDKPTVFSLCFLVMALFSIIFFNGKDAAGGTSLMGANRYIMATPYFIILLYLISHKIKFEKKYLLTYVLLAAGMFFLLRVDGGGFFNYNNQDKFYYRLLALIDIILFTLISTQWKGRFIPMIYLMNIVAQVLLISQFAKGIWVG